MVEFYHKRNFKEKSWILFLAWAISFALGMFFIFVWSPLPPQKLTLSGYDNYNGLAFFMADGKSYPTMERIWGYPYFLAAIHRLFGDQLWIPLLFQAFFNSMIPLLLYYLVRIEIGRRAAVISALIAAIFSFNTVYVSTLASESICTVLLLVAVLLFSLGRNSGKLLYFGSSGLLASLAFQFRPNYFLFPFFLVAIYLITRKKLGKKLLQTFTFLAVFLAASAPWIIRNYNVSGLFVPMTTIGGRALWYGSLDIGPHLENWIYNPRTDFERPIFHYSSLEKLPLHVQVKYQTPSSISNLKVSLVFWTDRDTTRCNISPAVVNENSLNFLIPPQKSPTTVFYYFEIRFSSAADSKEKLLWSPRLGAINPNVYFVNTNHLVDADNTGVLLDIFDIIRSLRHVCYSESLKYADKLDINRDRMVTENDVRLAVNWLLSNGDKNAFSRANLMAQIREISFDENSILVAFKDDSQLLIPNTYNGKITELHFEPGKARELMFLQQPFTLIRDTWESMDEFQNDSLMITRISQASGEQPRVKLFHSINEVFFRSEPHAQRRYIALSMDNIQREPGKYLLACFYRAFRLFVIRGSKDFKTAYQFINSGLIWSISSVISILYLLGMILGVAISISRRYPVMLFLSPIIYISVTTCFFVSNMRYSIPVQPYFFFFISILIIAFLERFGLADSKKEMPK